MTQLKCLPSAAKFLFRAGRDGPQQLTDLVTDAVVEVTRKVVWVVKFSLVIQVTFDVSFLMVLVLLMP